MKIFPRSLFGETGGGSVMRSIAMKAGLAMLAAVESGCILMPRRPDTSAATAAPAPASAAVAPAVPQDLRSSASVEVVRTVGENMTFRREPTERQKFQVHLDFGKIFENQGSFDRALQEYQAALTAAEARGHGDLKPLDQALAHRRMAAVFDRLGRFQQSEDHYKKALKLGPKEARTWNDEGYSYYLQGRWAESEKSLRKALKLAPEDARIRTNLGLTLAAMGRSEEALTLLSRSEGDAAGHANLGYLLAATGQYEPARQEYRKALALRPGLAVARRALVQLDRQQGTSPDSGGQTQIAAGAVAPVRATDPGVSPASTSPPDLTSLPPLPSSSSIPYPKLPSRTLPDTGTAFVPDVDQRK